MVKLSLSRALLLSAFYTSMAIADVDVWPSTEDDHTKLQIVLPTSLMKKDGYHHKDALFGYPSYTVGSLQTQLVYTKESGCDKINTESWEPPFALLLDRGDCHFVEKVRNAQRAGARAVLIADDKCLCSDSECLRDTGDQVCETVLPFMADDESGADITIPSMLIKKNDGDAIKKELLSAVARDGVSNVMVKFDWGIPSPDGRVEWTLWQSAWDDQTVQILTQMQSIVETLGDRAYFTPQFVSYNGTKVGCHAKNGVSPCGNMCLNNGRYCLLDPSPFHDREIGASGADVVIENLRRKCIWKLVNEKPDTIPGVGRTWWAYVKASSETCGKDESSFKERSCAEKVMKSLSIDVEAVEECMQPYGISRDEVNPLLEEELKQQTDLQLLRLPALYVDGVHARGRVDPGSILGMICAGYGTHDPPAICSCANQSKEDLTACVEAGGNSALFSALTNGSGGYSFGSVFFMLLVVAGAVGSAGFVYYKRTQRQMRDQVRSILAEYMPMEDQALLDDVDGLDGLESPRMHPAQRAAAKSPRGYLPSGGFLGDEDDHL